MRGPPPDPSFFTYLRPFFMHLDPVVHTPVFLRLNSPFLTTAIASVASTYDTQSTQLCTSLFAHAQKLAAKAFEDGSKSLEVVQAYLTLLHWNIRFPPFWSDDRSWRMSLDLALSIATADDRMARQRHAACNGGSAGPPSEQGHCEEVPGAGTVERRGGEQAVCLQKENVPVGVTLGDFVRTDSVAVSSGSPPAWRHKLAEQTRPRVIVSSEVGLVASVSTHTQYLPCPSSHRTTPPTFASSDALNSPTSLPKRFTHGTVQTKKRPRQGTGKSFWLDGSGIWMDGTRLMVVQVSEGSGFQLMTRPAARGARDEQSDHADPAHTPHPRHPREHARSLASDV
jgi:hypothetical protein